jgi:RNA polymerase sigma-70 factor (ECF subfamily)
VTVPIFSSPSLISAQTLVVDSWVPGSYIEEHMSTVMLSDVTRAPLSEELDRIFREHHHLVFRTAYCVTGSREDAQDVAQTIFLRLLRRDSPPDLLKNPKAYLYRAAVNLSLNTIRSRRRHVQVNDAESFEKLVTPAAPDATEELHKRLYEAIAELDAESSQVLILRYVHNYSIADIAKLLGKSYTLITVRLFRSRTRLKQIIRASQGDER